MNYYSQGSNRISFAGEYVNGVLKIAAARTSDKDVFVRKIGRKKAEGRLVGNILIFCKEVPEEVRNTRTFVMLCKHMESSVNQKPNIVSHGRYAKSERVVS